MNNNNPMRMMLSLVVLLSTGLLCSMATTSRRAAKSLAPAIDRSFVTFTTPLNGNPLSSFEHNALQKPAQELLQLRNIYNVNQSNLSKNPFAQLAVKLNQYKQNLNMQELDEKLYDFDVEKLEEALRTSEGILLQQECPAMVADTSSGATRYSYLKAPEVNYKSELSFFSPRMNAHPKVKELKALQQSKREYDEDVIKNNSNKVQEVQPIRGGAPFKVLPERFRHELMNNRDVDAIAFNRARQLAAEILKDISSDKERIAEDQARVKVARKQLADYIKNPEAQKGQGIMQFALPQPSGPKFTEGDVQEAEYTPKSE